MRILSRRINNIIIGYSVSHVWVKNMKLYHLKDSLKSNPAARIYRRIRVKVIENFGTVPRIKLLSGLTVNRQINTYVIAILNQSHHEIKTNDGGGEHGR